MARKRMIDPDFWLDEELAELNPYTRLLYIGLWGICDDNHATLPFKPRWIKAQIFPYNDGVDVDKYLEELIRAGKLRVFSENDDNFLWIKNFFKFQRVERPSAQKYPQYQAEKEITHRGLTEGSPRALPEVKLSKEKRSKVKLIKDNTAKAVKTSSFGNPEINEVIQLFEETYGFPLTGKQKNRYAANRLLKVHGLEKVKQSILAAHAVISEPYAPQITNIMDLEEKMPKLVLFYQKNNSQQGGKVVSI